MTIFTDSQYDALKSIIWQIESKNKYNYIHTDPETNIVRIGIAGWVDNDARNLIKQIKMKDTINSNKINNKGVRRTDQSDELSILLSSAVGKIIQNRFFKTQIDEYCNRISTRYDIKDIRSLALCCFIAHHSGYQSVNAVINKTNRPYSLDNLYTTCYMSCGDICSKDTFKYLYQHIKSDIPVEINHNSKGGNFMISTCGHDEKGGYTGGQAGDQTGKEWYIRAWYDGKWNYVMRHPDPTVREMIADLAEKCAKNDHIGYDQGQRTTLWYHLKAANYDPTKIAVDCEADCSSGVSAIVKAVGCLTNNPEMAAYSESNWTGSMLANMRACGFEALSARKYLTGDSYLARGDILLNTVTHTCINLTDGPNCEVSSSGATHTGGDAEQPTANISTSSNSSISYDVQWAGYVTENVTPRTWAGNSYPSLKSISTIPKGSAVGVCSTVKGNNKNNWYFVKINGSVWGFIPANTVSKSEVNKTSQTSSVPSKVPSKTPVCVGKVTAVLIDVKTWAGAEYNNIKSWPQLAKGNLVDICDTVKDSKGKAWYYVRIAGKYYGFVHSAYLKRV